MSLTASASGSSSPRLLLSDAPLRVTDALALQIDGLRAGQQLAIAAELIDGKGVCWRSHARFTAGAKGVIDLARHAPEEGSYTGADARGLFWSMRPAEARHAKAQFAVTSQAPLTTALTPTLDGQPFAQRSVVRELVPSGVVREAANEAGAGAVLFRPAGSERLPALLVLGGSEGGVPELAAALLAAQGYAALALGYFGAKGLPGALVELPVEALARGLQWLQARGDVDPDRVGVFGASKGAEAALTLAAHVPGVAALVLYSPSSVVWQGLNPLSKKGSWTLGGKPLPFVPYAAGLGELLGTTWRMIRGQTVAFRPFYERSLDVAEQAERAAIPVERIAAPLLLVGAEDDAVWPSGRMAQAIAQRRSAHGVGAEDELLVLDGAGHLVSVPALPTWNMHAMGPLLFGGTPEGRARAEAESWHRTLRFLARTLGARPAG